jgi:hypothetical protein
MEYYQQVKSINLPILFDSRSAQVFQYYDEIGCPDFLISIEFAFFRGMLSSIATLIAYETNSDFSNSLTGGHFSHCPRH